MNLSPQAQVRLLEQFAQSNLPVVGIDATGQLSWSVPPTAQQSQQAASIVAAFDPAPTETERLDAIRLPPRVLAALLIRASSGWSSLSAARRNRVMQIIDEAAQAAVQQLT